MTSRAEKKWEQRTYMKKNYVVIGYWPSDGLLFRWIYALAMFLCVTRPLALQITVLCQRLPRLNFFIHQLLKYVLGLNELFCMTVSSDRFVVAKATKLSIHFGGAYLQLSLTAYLRVWSRVSRLTSQSFAIKKYGLKAEFDWFEDIESGNPISQVFVLLDRFGCIRCWSLCRVFVWPLLVLLRS